LGQPLCRGTLGNRFGKQLCGTALGEQLWQAFRNNFEEQLIILKNSSFGEQLLGVALQTTSGSSSQQQLWGAAFGSHFVV